MLIYYELLRMLTVIRIWLSLVTFVSLLLIKLGSEEQMMWQQVFLGLTAAVISTR